MASTQIAILPCRLSTLSFATLARYSFMRLASFISMLLFAGLTTVGSAVGSIAWAQSVDGSVSNYRLGAGDVITVQVLGEDDLKREKIRLSDAATLSYPILGEIRLLGKTVGELEILIRDGLLGRYLLNPQVTVTINEYRSFFINGQVERPGGYAFIPGLTVRKAVSLAGGFKERASKEKIFVIREDDPKQTPQRVDLNASLNPGDIITIEESFF